jgi:hypothetical protein
MKPALALGPVHWQGEVVGAVRQPPLRAVDDRQTRSLQSSEGEARLYL